MFLKTKIICTTNTPLPPPSCSYDQDLEIKTSPSFHFIGLSVKVFSIIKFYSVPAGRRVRGDSPEKEVSTRCCEPSHAITATLSRRPVPFLPSPQTLPRAARQRDGTATAARSAALSIYRTFLSFHGFFSPSL